MQNFESVQKWPEHCMVAGSEDFGEKVESEQAPSLKDMIMPIDMVGDFIDKKACTPN